MSFKQIEKFQCLKSSTTQGLSHGIFRTHVARVQKGVSKFVNFKVQKVQNRNCLIDLTDNGFCSSDVRGLICHIPHLCAIFQTNNVGLGTCDENEKYTQRCLFLDWKFY